MRLSRLGKSNLLAVSRFPLGDHWITLLPFFRRGGNRMKKTSSLFWIKKMGVIFDSYLYTGKYLLISPTIIIKSLIFLYSCIPATDTLSAILVIREEKLNDIVILSFNLKFVGTFQSYSLISLGDTRFRASQEKLV